MSRSVLLLAHTGRPKTAEAARHAVETLVEAGVDVRLLDSEAAQIAAPRAIVVPASEAAASGVEVVLVLGGDGTILRAAELARGAKVPLLGVNLGRVGFLAEAEASHLDSTLDHVLARDLTVEERLTAEVTASLDG